MRHMTQEDMEYRQGRSLRQVERNEETMYLAYKYGLTFIAVALVIKILIDVI